MTEDQIERKVERAIDVLDRLFLAGKVSQEAYDAEIVAWDKWADQQYRHAKTIASIRDHVS